jgi:hypothetical protein
MALALVGCLLASVGALSATSRNNLASLKLQGTLTLDDTTACPNIVSAGVVYPSSVEDIATIVRAVASSDSDLTVAARGLGHNIRGRSQVTAQSIFGLIPAGYLMDIIMVSSRFCSVSRVGEYRFAIGWFFF